MIPLPEILKNANWSIVTNQWLGNSRRDGTAKEHRESHRTCISYSSDPLCSYTPNTWHLWALGLLVEMRILHSNHLLVSFYLSHAGFLDFSIWLKRNSLLVNVLQIKALGGRGHLPSCICGGLSFSTNPRLLTFTEIIPESRNAYPGGQSGDTRVPVLLAREGQGGIPHDSQAPPSPSCHSTNSLVYSFIVGHTHCVCYFCTHGQRWVGEVHSEKNNYAQRNTSFPNEALWGLF